MILLTEEKFRKNKEQEELFNTEILEHNIIGRFNFSGKLMSPEDFESFRQTVNKSKSFTLGLLRVIKQYHK